MRVVDDVKALYEFFRRVDLFTSPNVAFKIDEMTFGSMSPQPISVRQRGARSGGRSKRFD